MTAPDDQSSPSHLTIGRVSAPRGLRGELKVRILEDYLPTLPERDTLFLGDPPVPYPVESVRIQPRGVILKLANVDTREQAESLRQQNVLIPFEDAPPLEDGEYYVFQIIGLEVYTDQGAHLGEVFDVIFTGSNEVYVVRGPQGEFLIPAIANVIQHVDLHSGRIVITPLEGLL